MHEKWKRCLNILNQTNYSLFKIQADEELLLVLFDNFFSISLGAQEKSNNVAYEDTNVRFTVISDGTIRMEYAPDGKFINQHSFLAVERNYPAVKFKLKKGAWIELSTSKMKLRYKKIVVLSLPRIFRFLR